MAKLDIKSPWDAKFLREEPFMAFGSMMNAFGRINAGKFLTLEAFEAATDKIFELAKKYTEDAFENASGSEDNVDIPIKIK